MKKESIRSIQKLKHFAKRIAEQIEKKQLSSHARVVALSGDLGSGKTTFTREFARLFHVKQVVVSPTFLLFRPYPIPASAKCSFTHLYHVDVYRIEDKKELDVVGFQDILKNPHYIIVIEWAEKIKDMVPRDAFWIFFEHGVHENERIVAVKEE